jgi:hypothetical protein
MLRKSLVLAFIRFCVKARKRGKLRRWEDVKKHQEKTKKSVHSA